MPHMFGVGTGRLTRSQVSARREAAAKHGCSFVVVTGNDGHCTCGHGCEIDKCPNKRYWFVGHGPQLGEPFDSATARAVLGEIKD